MKMVFLAHLGLMALIPCAIALDLSAGSALLSTVSGPIDLNTAFNAAITALSQTSSISVDNSTLIYRQATNVTRVPHSYMVILKKSVDSTIAIGVWTILEMLGVKIVQRYEKVFRGCSMRLNSTLPLELIRKIPWIDSIEEDHYWTTTQVEDLSGTNSNWGLDRIDQSHLPLDNSYTFDLAGKGVNVFILDSGVDVSHREFGGRAKTVYVSPQLQSQGGVDCTGHGTHVAGVIGGTNSGVAKLVNLLSVRVIGCDDNSINTEVIAAIEWITQNAVLPAIINMSLGPIADNGAYPRSASMDVALAAATNAGIHVFVAAGNTVAGGVDACTGSPAGSPGVITVGATNNIDYRASFSNIGQCIALFGPGVGIVSSIPGNIYGTKSGTSQATPFVAGVGALQLEKQPHTTPSQMLAALRSAAVQGVVQDVQGSPNYLVQSIQIPAKGSNGAAASIVTLLPPLAQGLSVQSIIMYALIGVGSVAFMVLGIFGIKRFRRSRLAKRRRRLNGLDGQNDEKPGKPRMQMLPAVPPMKKLQPQKAQLREPQKYQHFPTPMPSNLSTPRNEPYQQRFQQQPGQQYLGPQDPRMQGVGRQPILRNTSENFFQPPVDRSPPPPSNIAYTQAQYPGLKFPLAPPTVIPSPLRMPSPPAPISKDNSLSREVFDEPRRKHSATAIGIGNIIEHTQATHMSQQGRFKGPMRPVIHQSALEDMPISQVALNAQLPRPIVTKSDPKFAQLKNNVFVSAPVSPRRMVFEENALHASRDDSYQKTPKKRVRENEHRPAVNNGRRYAVGDI